MAGEVALAAGEMEEIKEINMDSLEIPEAPDLEIPDLEIPDLDLSDLDLSDIVMPKEQPDVLNTDAAEGQHLGEASDIEIPDTEVLDTEVPHTEEKLSLEDMDMPESDNELKLEDIEMPEVSSDESFQESDLSIEGLDKAIQSETELQMAGELNIDELDFDNIGGGTDDLGAGLTDLELPDDSEGDASIGMDDNLEDVLNMLDNDAELAEINDMLKKSDNNEPIQDDMMDLLHQMADDEAASVNAGIKHVDDEDDGVPLPELPQSVLNAEQTDQAAPAAVTAEDDSKKKGKKVSVRKAKGGDGAAEGDEPKKPGVFGKFFNLLTEDLVPEPTEEELAAEKEAKAAKKQEQKAKKEEEKLANDETKKAKDEEKEAAKKAKQEAAAQKKKEKQAEKEKKAAAKRAKLEAEGPKKRIPPKKIAVGAVFGATVGGAVIIATNTLATQGFLQSARNAYIAEDYKTVYQLMYDMDLDENSSEGRIKAKSEILLKMQRRYDSYQTNMKMGREVEALDALLQGITTYDQVNADAEKYEVMEEVDAIKAEILEILQTNYHLDETGARELIRNEDALSYTIALNDVINGN